jgi:hypothetical protein
MPTPEHPMRDSILSLADEYLIRQRDYLQQVEWQFAGASNNFILGSGSTQLWLVPGRQAIRLHLLSTRPIAWNKNRCRTRKWRCRWMHLKLTR